MKFEWNDKKSENNYIKNKISFAEAITVFDDSDAIFIPDPDHSFGEERFLLLGLSGDAHMLVVCHCYRENDNVIRIISARLATKRETEQYYKKLGW